MSPAPAAIPSSCARPSTRAITIRSTDDFTGFVRGQGGQINAFGGQDLRIIDNFNVGPTLVRGFAPGGIGPRDISDPNNLQAAGLGGTTYFGGTAEVQFPIFGLPREIGLKGAVFADAGTLFGYNGPDEFLDASRVAGGHALHSGQRPLPNLYPGQLHQGRRRDHDPRLRSARA